MIVSTASQTQVSADEQAAIIYQNIQNVSAASKKSSLSVYWKLHLPYPSWQRKVQSLQEKPYQLNNGVPQELGDGPDHPDTVLYLAYGSNLSAETFQGRRGIRPLSQVNVVVPELVMTFDLAGLPYIEPCFANTKYRHASTPASVSEKSQLLPKRTQKYHKDRWKKGLVGVVYEVTKADYVQIIATEGGGASYQDVLVHCYALPPTEDIVPEFPTSQPFRAHTLYSPILPPGETPEKGGRFSRPDPSYAQPSARYLKLITDGADEHALPGEYKDYLHQIRPYTMTTQKQRLGAWILSTLWLPLISAFFGLSGIFRDENGQAPAWLVAITGAMFRGMWIGYDGFFFHLFGDGERTYYEDEDESDGATQHSCSSRYNGNSEKGTMNRCEEV